MTNHDLHHDPLIQAMIDTSKEGVAVVENYEKILLFNKQFQQMWNIPDSLLVRKSRSLILQYMLDQVKDADVIFKKIREETEASKEGKLELELLDGKVFELRFKNYFTEENHLERILFFHDITAQKELEKHLLATGEGMHLLELPNRPYLLNRIDQSIASSKQKGEKVALFDVALLLSDLIYLDISNQEVFFAEFFRRMGSCLLERDFVGRLGKGECVIVKHGNGSAQEFAKLASELILLLLEPYAVKGTKASVFCHVGVSIYPEDGNHAAMLLSKAEMAREFAATRGWNQVHFYSEDLHRLQLRRLRIEDELREALKKNELFLVYQPIVNLQDEKIVGLETLLRWTSPFLGIISPTEFIPIAEESDLIHELGHFVMQRAFQEALPWQKKGVKLAINLSGGQLHSATFIDTLEEALKASAFDPKGLEIELTESVLISSQEVNTLKQLDRLKSHGIALYVDDFGMGYSCLSYLKDFPLDALKLDCSFVQCIPNNTQKLALVDTIIAIAKHLDLDVVAEGVETEEQKKYLLKKGCDFGQGFYFSKPLKKGDVNPLFY